MHSHREGSMINRREFLRNAIAVVIASRFAAGSAAEKPAPAKKITMLLIGDGFVAKQVAEVATRHGHTVTQVSRGLRKGEQVLKREQVLNGEDKTDLIVAEGQRWDAVVDTSARVPADVKRLPRAVVEAAGYYLLLSSTSVYAKLDKPGIDESAPVQKTST